MPRKRQIPPSGGDKLTAAKLRKLDRETTKFFDFPEVYCLEDDLFTVREPPPKLPFQSRETITFPMGENPPLLPDLDGPKMHPFATGDVEVEFVREISTEGVHSNLIEVIIGSKHYALKMFRTFDIGQAPAMKEWMFQGSEPGEHEIWEYFKPFHCECRAYSRIQEHRVHDRYWECYGYLRLPGLLREKLYEVTGLPEHYWQTRPIFDDNRDDLPTWTLASHAIWPIYCLVKELAPADANPINTKLRSIRLMKGDLACLHKLGIYNYDIAARNYKDGRIVDFSKALTQPHIWFCAPDLEQQHEHFHPRTFKREIFEDKVNFHDMIYESGVKTRMVHVGSYEKCGIQYTRQRYRWCQSRTEQPLPLWELGVKEPPPSPKERTIEDFLANQPSTPSNCVHFSVPSDCE